MVQRRPCETIALGCRDGPGQKWEVALMLSEFLFYLLGLVAAVGPFSS